MALISLRSDSFPVGLLFSRQSITAAFEMTQYHGTLLAIEEINAAGGIDGLPLSPVEVDIGPDPHHYKQAAEFLCDEKQVRILFGTHMSNTRKAVLPVVESRQSLLFYSTLYEGFEFSQNCIYSGAAPNQNSVQLARHLLEHYGSRVLFVGHNYVFARESNRIMRDLFEEAGGQVVDECYLPLNAPQDRIEAVIGRATMLAPDAIYSTVVGADTVRLYEAFARSHLRNRDVPIASLAANEADLAAMSNEAAEGHISAAPYFQSLDTEISRQFIQRFKTRFGPEAHVTAGAEAAYFQVYLFAKAVKLTKARDLDSLIAGLSKVTFDAPQGQVKIDPENHHTYLWPRIARVDANCEFIIIEEEPRAIRPEPYMIEHSFRADVAKEA